MANVDPLQRHVATHVVGGWSAVEQLPGWFAATAHVPVGKSLRAAVDLALNASCLLGVTTLHEQLSALVFVQREVTLIRAQGCRGANLYLREYFNK